MDLRAGVRAFVAMTHQLDVEMPYSQLVQVIDTTRNLVEERACPHLGHRRALRQCFNHVVIQFSPADVLEAEEAAARNDFVAEKLDHIGVGMCLDALQCCCLTPRV